MIDTVRRASSVTIRHKDCTLDTECHDRDMDTALPAGERDVTVTAQTEVLACMISFEQTLSIGGPGASVKVSARLQHDEELIHLPFSILGP